MWEFNRNKYIILHLLQLPEIVNSVSPQGQLPLGIALMGRSTTIAQTLVQNGKADVNAYNTEVNINSFRRDAVHKPLFFFF